MTGPRPWPFADFAFDIDRGEWPADDAPAAPIGCLHFSGLALAGSELLSSRAELTERLADGRLTLDSLLVATGYFTAVIRNGGEVLFVNDLLGAEHLYLYEGASGPVVANHLPALVEVLRGRGATRRVNLPFAATMLASNHTFFAQCHAHDLAIEGVSLVPLDRYAVVTGGRLSLRPKPLHEAAFGGPSERYENLVDRAAAEILDNVRAIHNSPLFDAVLADLSAGTDSRVVYGAVVKAGLVEAIPVDSWNRDGEGDLRKALRICEYYGSPLHAGSTAPRFPVDAASALGRWRGWRGAMYHHLHAYPASAEGGDLRTVRLTGGCSGAFNAVWSKWLRKAFDRPDAAGLRGAIFDRLAPGFPEAYRRSAIDWLFSVLEALPGAALEEKADNHYAFFRNRTHFGIPAHRMMAETALWTPLASPAMLLASRALPWRERQDARLMFDLQKRLTPELNFFRYGKRVWPERFLPESPPRPGVGVDVAAARGRWDEAQATRAARDRERTRDPDAAFTPGAFKSLCRAEVAAAYPRIADAAPELAAILGRGYLERILAGFDHPDDDKSWRMATSKILSLADMLLDPGDVGAGGPASVPAGA